MLGIHYKNTSFQNNKTNVNHNTNRYSNNGGGTSTMARKHSSKFSKISSNKSFSLNGYNNHTYIGNQNNFISHDPFSSSNNCTKHVDNNYSQNTKSVSTKNTKGIINEKLRCSPVYSLQCYKNANQELIEKFENDGGKPGDGINKHFINGNKDHDIRTKNLSSCSIDRRNYINDITNNTGTNCSNKYNNNYNTLINNNNCNITKDLVAAKVYVPDYELYSLMRNLKCLHNPKKNGKVIAC